MDANLYFVFRYASRCARNFPEYTSWKASDDVQRYVKQGNSARLQEVYARCNYSFLPLLEWNHVERITIVNGRLSLGSTYKAKQLNGERKNRQTWTIENLFKTSWVGGKGQSVLRRNLKGANGHGQPARGRHLWLALPPFAAAAPALLLYHFSRLVVVLFLFMLDATQRWFQTCIPIRFHS